MTNEIDYRLDATQKIEAIMGEHSKWFEIKYDSELDFDSGRHSCLISVKPKNRVYGEFKIENAETATIEFIFEDDDIYLIIGEDTEIDATRENIYEILYWNEVFTYA